MRGTGELILYLDFDGVLHHQNCLWHPKIGAYLSAPEGYVLFQHAELLEQLLALYPQVRIVLSTAWVLRYGCSKTAKNLRPALRSRVIGATYHTNMREFEFTSLPRGRQVWSDVLKRKPRDWVALDDVDEGWPEHARGHYVRTHERDGLGDPVVLAVFREKLQRMCQANYRVHKCPRCNWVHAAIPLSVAEAQVASANECSRSQGRPQTVSMEHYWQCFRCEASTEGFVPAGPDDAPMGCAIQGVVVPGILP